MYGTHRACGVTVARAQDQPQKAAPIYGWMARGRKQTKLTAELISQVCAHLRAGQHRKVAAGLVRVGESTFGKWYQTGAREPRGLARDFFEGVNEAESQFEAAQLSRLLEQAEAAPKIRMWVLSRRFPQRYSRQDNVADSSGAPGQANVEELRELLLSRLERLAQPAPKADAEAAADAE